MNTGEYLDTYLEASGANLYFLDAVLESGFYPRPGRFLDVGCGTGVFAECLQFASGMTGYGTEMSPSAHSIASKRIVCSLVSGLKLPFESDFFTLVTAKDVLPMITDKKTWFREICRVLKKGCKFVTYLPNDHDYAEKPLYSFIPGSEEATKVAYGRVADTVELMSDAGFSETRLSRLHLGTVQMDLSYVQKHLSGFFNNTEKEEYSFGRNKGLHELADGMVALSHAGITTHFEWERTLIEACKNG